MLDAVTNACDTRVATFLVLNPPPMPHRMGACVVPDELTADYLHGLTGHDFASGFSTIKVIANGKPCTMVVDVAQYSDDNMPVNAEASRILTATISGLGVRVYSRLIVRGSAVLFSCVIPHAE